MPLHWKIPLGLAASIFAGLIAPAGAQQQPRNVILFVPDGLRALKVTPETAPTMAAIRDNGVNFQNPHSLFPTFTMANGSALATGHQLGDSGTFSNTIYTGFPVSALGGTVTPFLESDPVLAEVDAHFAGDYISEETLLKAARTRGFSTAAIGKLGPVLMFDHTERDGEKTIVIDDATGNSGGIPVSAEVKSAMDKLGLNAAPGRGNNPGDNGNAGAFDKPGAKVANVTQQKYFADVTTKVVLPMFKARNKPFILVYWSRDPDGTQHNHGDNPLQLTPGINGPTSLAAIKNADDNLAQIKQTLSDLGLAETTNIVIAADHGFSTISKQSETSPAAKASYADVPPGLLPSGFLALDLAKALALPLWDPEAKNARVADNAYPKRGNGLIGQDAAKPDVVVAANGGSDLIYLPGKDKKLAARVVEALLAQDYVSGLFVDDDFGPFAGTLPLSAIHLKGKAVTPTPSIVVNFRSFATGCDQPLLCTVAVADTGLQHGQGMHGSFSRADTMNFMAAIGPDFKTGFADSAPVSNADVGRTLAAILGLKIPSKGRLLGRVISEALPGGTMPAVIPRTRRSSPSVSGLRTILVSQRVGKSRYFDAAGFPGRTVGLEEQQAARR
jgi:hypothetical protein